ncbi:MAG: response regulator [Candidatus Cloacimonadales bacterium]
MKTRFSHSIILRFVAIFIFLGLVPLLSIMVWAIYGSNQSIMNHLEGNVFELIKQKAEYTALQLSTVENLMNNISNVEDVTNSLREESDELTTYQRLNIQAKIGYVLAGYINIEGIESIDIFSKNNNRYHLGQSLIKEDTKIDETFISLLDENKSIDSEIIWHGVKKSIDNPDKFSLVASKRLSVVDHETMKKNYLGIMVVHYSLEGVSEQFNDDSTRNFTTFVVDMHGNIIHDPERKDVGKDFKAINEISKERLHNFDKVNFGGRKTLLLKYNLDKYGLKFFTFISSKYLWHAQFDYLRISLIGLITIVIFSLIIFSIFTRRILFPIKELTEAFVAITKNRYDLDSQIPIKSIDEIGELQMWFNSFVKNMKEKNEYATELVKQKELAEIANKAKDSFLASISHELRTPLNGVISVSELLNDTSLSQEQEEYVDIIQQSSNILFSLINQVLDFSKISANKLILTPVCFDLIKLFERMAKLYRIQCKIKNLDFNYKSLPDKFLLVQTDEMAIQKILINLLSNSVKYTETGEISFGIEQLERNESSIMLRISVADTGLGIPEKKKKTVFEAFEQVDGSLSKKISGTGLGLSIAQQLAYLLESEIRLLSPNPQCPTDCSAPGSIFYFDITLPLITDDKSTIEETSDVFELPPNLHSLVVEDNIVNQKVITAIIKKQNVKVDVASNWRECLAFLKDREYDYIFMDIQMPEVTGFELTKMIRDKGIKTPIIAVSGNVIDEVKEQAITCGMDDFIVKPIKTSEIRRMLQKYKNN